MLVLDFLSRVLLCQFLKFASVQSVNLEFGTLKLYDNSMDPFTNQSIHVIKEDKYQPGSIILGVGHALHRFTPGKGTTVLAGEVDTPGNRSGLALQARFSLIIDFDQRNETNIVVADFLNRCVRDINTVTGEITTMIGICDSNSSTMIQELPSGVSLPLNATIGPPTTIVYMPQGEYFLTCDFLYGNIYKVDPIQRTMEIKNSKYYLPETRSIVPNSDGTLLYMSHSTGIARVNASTFEYETIVGEVVFNVNDKLTKLVPGSFKTAKFGKINSLAWLIPDRVLVGLPAKDQEALGVFDLESKCLSFLCEGSMRSRVTIPGPLNKCQLNSAESLFVSDNKINIASKTKGNWDEDGLYNYTSSLYTLNFSEDYGDSTPRSDSNRCREYQLGLLIMLLAAVCICFWTL